jgi:hypothetical protein
MHRSLRWGIAITLVWSIMLLARQQAAGAAQPLGQSGTVRGGLRGSQAAAGANDKGTVKPPPGTVLIPVTGDYSVGGFCVLSVGLDDPAITLDARLITPLPAGLPDTVQRVRQGCLLTYFHSGERIPALSPEGGSTTICFAAPPPKQATVYFQDTYAPSPEWVPLETTVRAGIACAAANASGTYVATFLKD